MAEPFARLVGCVVKEIVMEKADAEGAKEQIMENNETILFEDDEKTNDDLDIVWTQARKKKEVDSSVTPKVKGF